MTYASVRDYAVTIAEQFTAELALLDRNGCIVAVNDEWNVFCLSNGGDLLRTGVGVSYLDVCDAAADDPGAKAVADGIRAAVNGRLPAPLKVRIDCDSPHQRRRFDVLISARLAGDKVVGAAVRVMALPAERNRAGTDADFDAHTDSDFDMVFPRLARAEVEQALIRVAARTQDALHVQRRQRALLRAHTALGGELNLAALLQRIVTAAGELAQARAAALGLLDSDGRLAHVIESGMSQEQLDGLSALGRDRGTASGLATDYSFLGVPIRVGDELFGTLYLTQSEQGRFSEEDEQLLIRFAAGAGDAITSARRYHHAQQQRTWLAASTELTQQLFAGSAPEPLAVVANLAMRAAGAQRAALTLPVNDHQGRVAAETGAPLSSNRLLALDHTLAGRVLRCAKPVLIVSYEHTPDGKADADLPTDTGSAVGVPLLAADGRVLAALTVARTVGFDPFTDLDTDQLAGFASHAGLALELDRSRRDHETLSRAADRERIAAELRDDVIADLFSVGIGLQGLIGATDDPVHRARLSGYVSALDATVRRIRVTIFGLRTEQSAADSLQQRVLDVLDEESHVLGYAVGVEFTVPLDVTVSCELADDVVAAIHEALSRIAGNAQPTSVGISVVLTAGLLTLSVTAEGEGLANLEHSEKLVDLRRRAQSHGGDLTVRTSEKTGTRLTWTARI